MSDTEMTSGIAEADQRRRRSEAESRKLTHELVNKGAVDIKIKVEQYSDLGQKLLALFHDEEWLDLSLGPHRRDSTPRISGLIVKLHKDEKSFITFTLGRFMVKVDSQ